MEVTRFGLAGLCLFATACSPGAVAVAELSDEATPPSWPTFVALTREVAARRECCEDQAEAVWSESTFQLLRLKLDPEADAPIVREGMPSQGVPEVVANQIYALRDTYGGGELTAVEVSGGYAVTVDQWNDGDGYVLVLSHGGGIAEVDSGHGFTRPLAVRADAFIAFERSRRAEFSLRCWKQGEGGRWTSTELLTDLRRPVAGKDALGEAVVVDATGRFHAVECGKGVSLIHDGGWYEEFAAGETQTQFECLLPSGLPESVRRYSDGRLAMTTRHHVVLLEPRGAEIREQWFGRASRCALE